MNQQQPSTSPTSKITKPIAKGCGCLSIFFFVFFIWGIWTTITTYSHIVEVDATVVDFVNADNVFMDARFTENQTPVITYQYEGNTYLDTINYSIDSKEELVIGTVTKVFINPEQPQFSIENSTSTFYFYFLFLVLALISFLVYKLLKKSKANLPRSITSSSSRSVAPISITSEEIIKNTAATNLNPTLTGSKNSSKEAAKDAPPWLAIAIGVVLILIGIGMGYYKFSRVQTAHILKEKGVQTKGIVSFLERGKRGNTGSTQRKDYYTISYTYNNVPYEYKTELSLVYYNINEELMLLVNPDKPSQAMLSSYEDLNRGSYLFALFLMVMGAMIILYQKKQLLNNKNPSNE